MRAAGNRAVKAGSLSMIGSSPARRQAPSRSSGLPSRFHACWRGWPSAAIRVPQQSGLGLVGPHHDGRYALRFLLGRVHTAGVPVDGLAVACLINAECANAAVLLLHHVAADPHTRSDISSFPRSGRRACA